jgi:hypothetical protein
MSALLRLGAFDVDVERCSRAHRELLEALFRTRLEPNGSGAPVDLQFAMVEGGAGAGFGSTDALESREENGRLHFVSDLVAGWLDQRSRPHQLTLAVDIDHPRVRHLDHYLRIVCNAVLRRLDRLRLHAAAVKFGGTTSLFVGDKGAGKTTICLHLARAGGTVLGEDQVMVRRTTSGKYLVAGGDGLMRVTAKTEAHFFPAPLDAPTIVLAGVPKKELDARDVIACEPHHEYPPRRIFFPEIGESFEIQRLTGREALGRLAAPLGAIHRFTSDQDRRNFLMFLAGMTRELDCFALTLTPEIDDLAALSEFLS